MVKSRLNRKSLKKNKRTKKSKIKHGGASAAWALKWAMEYLSNQLSGSDKPVPLADGEAYKAALEKLRGKFADEGMAKQKKICEELRMDHNNCNTETVLKEMKRRRQEQQGVYVDAHKEVYHDARLPPSCMDSRYPLGWLKEEECLVENDWRSDVAKRDPLSHLERFYFDNIVDNKSAGWLSGLRNDDIGINTVRGMEPEEVTGWLNEFAEDFIDEGFDTPPAPNESRGLVIDNDSEILNDMGGNRYPFADKIQLLLLLNHAATIKEQEDQYKTNPH